MTSNFKTFCHYTETQIDVKVLISRQTMRNNHRVSSTSLVRWTPR